MGRGHRKACGLSRWQVSFGLEGPGVEGQRTGRCFAETQRVGELGGFGYECLAVGSQHGIL